MIIILKNMINWKKKLFLCVFFLNLEAHSKFLLHFRQGKQVLLYLISLKENIFTGKEPKISVITFIMMSEDVIFEYCKEKLFWFTGVVQRQKKMDFHHGKLSFYNVAYHIWVRKLDFLNRETRHTLISIYTKVAPPG